MNITNRTTVSKRIPELDSLYVYSTRHKIKFTHRHQTGEGYRYTIKGAALNAQEGEIHIYHRTAEIKGVSQGLTVVTKNGKFREVQKFFNDQIKAIAESDDLYEKFSHAKQKPSELGIYYTY